jgi:ribosomal protein L11 methyltransferase
VTSGGYTRYTLRLPRAAVASAGAPAPEPEPDDWSGSAAFAVGADPVDYAHPDAVALISSLQPSGWQEEDDGDTLVFWLETGAETRDDAYGVLARLAKLGGLEAELQAPGWESAWKEFHRPQTVGRLYVRPPWYAAEPGLLDLAIDAGQAFGTGGHPTTRQCLEEIQRIEPGALLDIGCGSGVVSLAALRLGFTPVWGVDIDAVAVRAAQENAELNGLSADFSVADATDPACVLPAADTVVANLALGPILRLAPRFAAAAGPAATRRLQPQHLLLAGLLVEQADEAARAFTSYGEAGRRDDGEWALVHLVRL